MGIQIIYNSHKDQFKLHKKWNLYFDSFHLHSSYVDKQNVDIWKFNIDRVYEFSSVEQFWRVYNNIIEPDRMWQTSAYYVMTGAPCTDPDLQFFVQDQNINQIWLDLLLLLIGGTMPDSLYGVSLHREKKYYIINAYARGSPQQRDMRILPVKKYIEHIVTAFQN